MTNNTLVKLEDLELSSEELEQIEIRARDMRLKKLEREQIRITDQVAKQEVTIGLLTNTVSQVCDDYKNLKEATYVLATDDGKMKELTKLMQFLTYKCTGNKLSLKDQLFHKIITNACYKHLYGQYQINSYKRIKIDDYEESIKVIKRWFGNKENAKSVINKRLKEYVNDKNLPTYKQEMVDRYLELIGGNIDAI